MGSQRVRHDWVTKLAFSLAFYYSKFFEQVTTLLNSKSSIPQGDAHQEEVHRSLKSLVWSGGDYSTVSSGWSEGVQSMNISRAIGSAPSKWQRLPESLLFEPSMSLLLNPELTSPKFHESGTTSVFSQKDWLFICFIQERVLSYHKTVTPALCQLSFLTHVDLFQEAGMMVQCCSRCPWGEVRLRFDGMKAGKRSLALPGPHFGFSASQLLQIFFGATVWTAWVCHGGWVTR